MECVLGPNVDLTSVVCVSSVTRVVYICTHVVKIRMAGAQIGSIKCVDL